AVLIAIMRWRSPSVELSNIARLSSDGVVVAFTVIAGAPAAVATIAIAVRLARASFAQYLALKPFALRELLLGLACLAVYALAADLITWLAGYAIVAAFVRDTVNSAAAAHALLLFIAAVTLVAPLSEEITMRGFLYRGFAASGLGPAGAIVLTSA